MGGDLPACLPGCCMQVVLKKRAVDRPNEVRKEEEDDTPAGRRGGGAGARLARSETHPLRLLVGRLLCQQILVARSEDYRHRGYAVRQQANAIRDRTVQLITQGLKL